MTAYLKKLDTKHRILYTIGILLSILGALVSIVIPLYIRATIDGEQYTLSQFLTILLIFILQALFVSIGGYFVKRCGEYIVHSYRNELFETIFFFRLNVFENYHSSEMASHIVNDTLQVKNFVATAVTKLSTSLVSVIGTIVILFLLDWQLAAVLVTTLPIIFLVIIPLSALNGKVATQFQEKNSSLIAVLTEKIRNIRLVKSQQAEKEVQSTLQTSLKELSTTTGSADLYDSIIEAVVFLVLFLVISLVFSYGAYRISNDSLSIGTLISFLIYLFQLMTPISSIGEVVNTAEKTKGATHYLQTLSSHEREDDAISSREKIDTSISTPIKLDLKEVSFAYNNMTVLEDISLSLHKNQKIAFVGPSGAGKSSLLDLIARFYEPKSGDICLNGQSHQNISIREWRQQIALVDQQQQLNSGTIRENLLFGLQHSVSNEQIKQVLTITNLSAKIASLPNGLDTEIGEDGGQLSGGEKQRIQIARALLKDSPILLLDESTSHLDSESEAIINQAIAQYKTNKIIMIVAHRLSTVIDADCIYFIDSGKITGSGTHEELKLTHAKYAEFVTQQMIE